MDITELTKRAATRDLNDAGVLEGYFECCRLLEEMDTADAHHRARHIYRIAGIRAKETVGENAGQAAKFLEIAKRAALFLAPHLFDYYLIYVEWNRPSASSLLLAPTQPLFCVTKSYDREKILAAIKLPQTGCYTSPHRSPAFSSVLHGYRFR